MAEYEDRVRWALEHLRGPEVKIREVAEHVNRMVYDDGVGAAVAFLRGWADRLHRASVDAVRDRAALRADVERLRAENTDLRAENDRLNRGGC